MLLNFKVAGIPCRRAGGIQGFRSLHDLHVWEHRKKDKDLVHNPRLQMGKGSDEQH